MIQIAVKNYYSDPLEHLPPGKEIWGKTKNGGELWPWCGFLKQNIVIHVMGTSIDVYFLKSECEVILQCKLSYV